MKTSDNGADFIKSWERFETFPYQDEGGRWTFGYGTTYDTGPKAVTAQTPPIEEDDAVVLLKRDLAIAEHCIDSSVTVPLRQNQYDALVSLCYNIGIGNFLNSTVLKDVNAGTDPSAAFLLWHFVKGKVSGGLERRREAEAALFRGTQG